MSDELPAPQGAVFLSYASQDAEPARRICEALRAAGVEVWFDQSELRGGDAWDAQIRRRIKECALFVPLISANTNARAEGYFRLEWKLAVDRSHLLADDHPFLFPIVMGDVTSATARVPDRFREVQWTRLRLDETPAELAQRISRLLNPAGPAGESGARTKPVARGAAAKKPSWTRHAWAAVGILFALVWVIRPLVRPARVRPPAAPATDVPAPATAGATEADQLTARAYALTQKLGFTRDDLEIAEGLARRATDQAPDSGRAWAVRAWVQAAYLMRDWDLKESRFQETQTAANRALRLDPNDADAMNALAEVFERRNLPVETEKMSRQALAADANNVRSHLLLGRAMIGQGKMAEARTILQAAAGRFPDNPLVHYELANSYVGFGQSAPASPEDLAGALAEIDRALAKRPFGSALAFKATQLASWRGDFAGMGACLRELEKLPIEERSAQRAIFVAILEGLWTRQPEKVFSAASLTVDEYFDDRIVGSPKRWWTALAFQEGGKVNSARLEWERAEATLRQLIKERPEETFLQAQLAMTLAWEGRSREAAEIMRPVEQVWNENLTTFRHRLIALYYAAQGEADAAVPHLRESLNKYTWFTDYTLPVDPWWEKLRGQPAFEQALAEAKARTTPKP